MLVDDGNALRVLRLQEAERLLEWYVRPDREVWRLGDRPQLGRAGVEPVCDDLAHECLPGDNADESIVLGHVDRPDLRPLEKLPGCLRRCIGRKLPGVRDHGLTNGAHGKIPRAWSASETSRIPATSAPERSGTFRSSAMSHTRSNAFESFSASFARISSRVQKRRPRSCTHSKYDTVTPPALVSTSGRTGIPRSQRMASASSDVGPFAPSAIMRVRRRGALSAVT